MTIAGDKRIEYNGVSAHPDEMVSIKWAELVALRQLADRADHSAGVGVNLHRKARELLAAEYARDGQAFVADRIRTDAMLTHVEDRSLRAIVAALAQPADADSERAR